MKQLRKIFLTAATLLCPLTAHSEDSTFKIEPQPTQLAGQLAFSGTVEGKEKIFILDFDSGRVRTAIDGPGNNNSPNWSADGRMLTFVSDRDGTKAVYVSDFDGQNQRRISSGTTTDDSPSFSPDGKKVIFSGSARSSSDEATSNIFSVDLKSKKIEQLTKFKGRNTIPRWAADGRQISYATDRFWPGWDICIWNVVEKTERCVLSGAQTYYRADWSRSGKKLVFSVGFGAQVDLHAFDLETKENSTIAEFKGRSYDGSWSPDDSKIVFASETAEGSNVFNLMIFDFKEKPRLLLSSSSVSMRSPSWTKAGTLELEARRFREQEGIANLPTPIPENSIVPKPVASTLPATTPPTQ